MVEGLFNLLASTSERKYAQVYDRAKTLSETLSADADLSIFGPSMVKTFTGENGTIHVEFRYHLLQYLQKFRSDVARLT